MSRRPLCGAVLVLLIGGANVLGADHKYEGKLIACPGQPGALVYQGKLIKLQSPNLAYCLATEHLTVSKAEYEAIPELGVINTAVPNVHCIYNRQKPGCLLGIGAEGKVARFAIDSPDLAAANQSPGCLLMDRAYAAIPHLADLRIKRKLPEPAKMPEKVPQWEYKIYKLTDADFAGNRAEVVFNQLAGEGWEFVTTVVTRMKHEGAPLAGPVSPITGTTCVLFKRPKK
jgi:hypothetical protein